MPLPFLKPKSVAGLIVQTRKHDGSMGDTQNEGQEDHALMSAATDLIRAVHSKDEHAVAAALRAAFEICDSEPHVEGPHETEQES